MMSTEPPIWLRVVDIAIGALSIFAALIVVLNPSYGVSTIASLLTFSLLFNTVRMFMTGGARQLQESFRGLGVAGGLISVAILGFLILSPGLGLTTLFLVVAAPLAVQGATSLAHFLHGGHPQWLLAF